MKEKTTIGRVERIKIKELDDLVLYARIDTGAKTSSISGEATICEDNRLRVVIHGEKNSEPLFFRNYSTTVVASSNGQFEERFKVKLTIVIKKRRIRAHFTIANRRTQVYPVLIGRNVLYGKFVVDVAKGTPLIEAERQRSEALQNNRSTI